MGKKGLPEITDSFTERTKREIKNGSLEKTVPGNGNTVISIGNGYKIRNDGKIIGQNNMPLIPVKRRGNRSPHVVITLKRKDPDGSIVSDKEEVRIDGLMEEYFGPHIEGYSKMKNNRDEKKTYIVVPKDGNWDDLSLGNLEYVVKEEYNLNGTKKGALVALLSFFKNKNTKSDEEWSKLLKVSRGRISRVKSELKEQGRIGDAKLNNLVISHKTYKIYEALLACDGSKSNLDLAKELRPTANFADKTEQNMRTDKVSRARRQLFDEGLIKKYNTYKKEVNIADVRQELEKMLIANRGVEKGKRLAHAEIAKMFGLEKQQVDNYSRQLKKRETQKNDGVSIIEEGI